MDDILRFPSAAKHDPAIDAWLAALSDDLRPFAETWFTHMRQRGGDVRELMHDGCPTVCLGDAAFAYVGAYRDHVNVGFFFGAVLEDPGHLLEGTGKRGRHVKLRSGREVDAAALVQLVEAAYVDIKARLGRRFADDSWFRFPQTRWSFANIRHLMPTAAVRRGASPPVPLATAERPDIDDVTFQPIGRSESMRWVDSLAANHTDGILILHRGRIVYERYFGALTADRQHIAMSITKSFVAVLAGTLMAEGILDDRDTVARYLPELESRGLGDATIRQLLDMTTSLDYTEDFSDTHSAVWDLCRAGGFLARPSNYRGAGSFFEYLKTLKKSGPHGERFVYTTPNADTLGAILSRATGKPLAELLSERIYARLGAEHDALLTVDATGAGFAGIGLNLTLRDLARFGEMIRVGGRWNDQQIVPKAVIDDISKGGDGSMLSRSTYPTLPGWSYRNMWWISHNDHGAFTARGIHGQALYIDPVAEMVIARFASSPHASNVHLDPTSLPAYDAVARQLMASAG